MNTQHLYLLSLGVVLYESICVASYETNVDNEYKKTMCLVNSNTVNSKPDNDINGWVCVENYFRKKSSAYKHDCERCASCDNWQFEAHPCDCGFNGICLSKRHLRINVYDESGSNNVEPLEMACTWIKPGQAAQRKASTQSPGTSSGGSQEKAASDTKSSNSNRTSGQICETCTSETNSCIIIACLVVGSINLALILVVICVILCCLRPLQKTILDEIKRKEENERSGSPSSSIGAIDDGYDPQHTPMLDRRQSRQEAESSM